MELTLPKPLDKRLSKQDAALHLAFGLYVTDEAMEIAVPEELARAMGQSVYGLEPKKMESKKTASP